MDDLTYWLGVLVVIAVMALAVGLQQPRLRREAGKKRFLAECREAGINTLGPDTDPLTIEKAELIAERCGLKFTDICALYAEVAGEDAQRVSRERTEALQKQAAAERAMHETMARYAALSGRAKRVTMLTDLLAQEQRKLKKLEAQEDALRTGLTRKENDVTLQAGIANGLAGGGAAVATAIHAASENVEIRRQNAATMRMVRPVLAQAGQDAHMQRERVKEIGRLLEEAKALLVDHTRTAADCLAALTLGEPVVTVSETGALLVTAEAAPREELTLSDGRRAVVDGTLLANIYDAQHRLVGTAPLVLPIGGVRYKFKLNGICLEGGEAGGSYTVELTAGSLFALEAGTDGFCFRLMPEPDTTLKTVRGERKAVQTGSTLRVVAAAVCSLILAATGYVSLSSCMAGFSQLLGAGALIVSAGVFAWGMGFSQTSLATQKRCMAVSLATYAAILVALLCVTYIDKRFSALPFALLCAVGMALSVVGILRSMPLLCGLAAVPTILSVPAAYGTAVQVMGLSRFLDRVFPGFAGIAGLTAVYLLTALLLRSDFRDAKGRAQQCRDRLPVLEKELKEKAEREAAKEERRKQDEAKAAKNKRIGIIAAVVAVICVVAFFVATNVVVPAHKYDLAMTYLQSGNTMTAYSLFVDLGDYRDSKQQAEEILRHAGFRVTSSTCDGETETYTYDARGNLSSVGDVQLEYEYYPSGNPSVCKITGANKERTITFYDTDGSGTVLDPAVQYSSREYIYVNVGPCYSYFRFSGVKREEYEDGDWTEYNEDGTCSRFYRTSNGKIISYNYKYDEQGRPIEKSSSGSTGYETYGYDEKGNIISYTTESGHTTSIKLEYSDSGLLSKREAGSSEWNYNYYTYYTYRYFT